MANVQIDNGDFTRIANEILEHIAKAKLNGTQHAIVLVIWRYTYGFQRKEADLSIGFLSGATGYDKRQIQRELKELEDRKIIKQSPGRQRVISFNKDYDAWVGKSTNGKSTNGENTKQTIGESTNPPLVNLPTKKESIKDKKKKNNVKQAFTEEEKSVANYLKDKLIDNGVSAFPRDWHLKQYGIARSLLISLTVDEVISCIDWGFKDKYWRTRIDGLQTIQRILPKWQLQNNRDGPREGDNYDWYLNNGG